MIKVPVVPVAPAAPVVPEVEAPAPELELADPEENEAFIEKESFEKAMAEALQDVGTMEEEEGMSQLIILY